MKENNGGKIVKKLKITNCRKDFLHKLTRKIIDNQDYSSIVIEDLSILDLLQDTWLAKHISSVGWREFRRQLEYKCKWYGKSLLVIGRFEPSSRLCYCGYYNQNLSLKDRDWTCPSCKTFHDRDILAANNIKRFAFCKQNTSKKFLGQELPEVTLGESEVTRTLNQEALN